MTEVKTSEADLQTELMKHREFREKALRADIPSTESPPHQPKQEHPTLTDAPNAPAFASKYEFPVKSASEISVEVATPDDPNIISRQLVAYVADYRTAMTKTARSILEMCRVVYEASRVLQSGEFRRFCDCVNIKSDGSTTRKYIAIGKLYHRFVPHADELPTSWTTIYQLTQLPEANFNELVSEGQSLSSLKASELKDLTNRTREIYGIGDGLRNSKKSPGTIIGTFMFTKWSVDDIDWRAMKKAVSELEARLPVRFLISHDAECIYQSRKSSRYEKTKKDYAMIELRPDLWDFGREANMMDDRADVVISDPEELAVDMKNHTDNDASS